MQGFSLSILGLIFKCRNTYLFVCLLFNSRMRLFRLHGDVYIAAKGYTVLDPCSVHTVMEKGGVLNVPQQLLLWQGPLLLESRLKDSPHLVVVYDKPWFLSEFQFLTRGRCTLHSNVSDACVTHPLVRDWSESSPETKQKLDHTFIDNTPAGKVFLEPFLTNKTNLLGSNDS